MPDNVDWTERKLTVKEGFDIATAVLNTAAAASGALIAGASVLVDPNVRTVIHQIARALGIGFQTVIGRSTTDEEVIVEIFVRLPVVLDAVREIAGENAQTALKQVIVNGPTTIDAAVQDLKEIAMERLSASQDLKGLVTAVLERHMLLPRQA